MTTPTTPTDGYDALRDAAGMARCESGAVLVSGPDTWSFLQSLVSQDVAGLADGDGARSLLLQPQGKLDVDFRVLRVGDDAWLEAADGLGARLATSLLRFRLRVAVDVVDRSGDFGLLVVRGPAAEASLPAALAVTLPAAAHAHVAWAASRVVRADWPGAPGFDVVGPGPDLDRASEALSGHGIVPVGADALDVVRIEAGVPSQGRDVDEQTIPQEAFLERDAVSFTKGCFLGQELVCRIDTRGHVNRYLRGLRIAGDEVPLPGTEVRVGERVVGTLTSSGRSPALGVVALAMVRREVEPPAPVTVGGPDGVAATVEALPLR